MAPTPEPPILLQELVKPFSSAVLYYLPIAAAFAVHAATQFKEPRGDHALLSFVIVASTGVYSISNAWKLTYLAALDVFCGMTAIFAAALTISVSTYRIFFHPLRNIPGPLSCKLSMLSWMYSDFKGTRAEQIRRLHQKYGDVVRIGPREVSCAHPQALTAIYGPLAKTIRGPWYTAQSEPHVHSLQNEPTLPEHNRRRRGWDPAFSIRALGTYRQGIQQNAENLLNQIENLARRGLVDIRECMMWFGFDMMGELGFGRSFDTIQAGETSKEVHLVETGVRAINTLGNVPYIADVVRLLPSPIAVFESWLDKALDWRIDRAADKTFVAADVFAYLLGEQGKQRRKLNRLELRQDCMLMVVAGSDTTSNAMTFCLYELAKQPDLVCRLREELAAICPETQLRPDDFDVLSKAELLNACINESLRLWPPVPSGLQRNALTPISLPCQDGEIRVPANTVLSTHTLTLHRDPRNFYQPERFIPDRWNAGEVDKPGSTGNHTAKAFSPFGYGVTSCIGKNLAFMEMRLVLAQFVARFDISLAEEDDVAFVESVRDQFVIATGGLKLRITPRKI